MKLILTILAALFSLPALADSATGILRVNGQPGEGQPAQVFLLRCRTDQNGAPVKFSCDGALSAESPDESLNHDIALSPGLYLVTYDQGASVFAEVKADGRTTLQLGKIDYPAGAAPSTVRVFLDLTDPAEQTAYLGRLFGLNELDLVTVEKGCVAPLLKGNRDACDALNNATRPSEYLNKTVSFDSDGQPLFWNYFHHQFIGADKRNPCVGLNCMAAGESGRFVAVLPGTYGLAIFSADGSARYQRGLRSQPE